MQSITIELSNELLAELEQLVSRGWFDSPEDAAHFAISELVSPRRVKQFSMHEHHQEEDITWGASQNDHQCVSSSPMPAH